MKKVYDFCKNLKEFKIEMAIEEYKNNIPNITQKQIEFATGLTNKIFNLEDDGVIEVNYNRCGMGKSTILKAILNQLVNNYYYIGKVSRDKVLDYYGAIVITDRLDRLEEISQYKGLEDRCYFMKYDKNEENVLHKNYRVEFEEQLREQYKYPIVLISTQKYFKMKDNERNLLYKWKNGYRKIKFCDEKQPIISTVTIDEKYLSNIRVELEALPKGEDKTYLLEYWKRIYEWIDGLREEYTEYDINWVCGAGEDIILNRATDNKFFNKLKEYVSNKIYNDIEAIKEINESGCLFLSSSESDQDNSRQFILIRDNTDKLDVDKCKSIIFDATAYYDIDYTISDKYKIFKFDDSKESDIELHHIKVSTSQRRLKSSTSQIENISKYINTLGDKTFIATYGKKNGLFQKFNSFLKSEYMAYFGDIKGKNDWNDFNSMAHIGLNRKSNYVYLITYIALTKVNKKWNEIQDVDKTYTHINSLLENKNGIFTLEKMRRIMESDLAVDAIQNIMRIKCRHFNNTDMCKVYMLCSETYSPVVEKVKKVLGLDEIIEYVPDIIGEAKEQNTSKKDGTKTVNQRFKAWFDKWNGNKVEIKEIKTALGFTDKDWENVKKSKTWKCASARFETVREGKKYFIVRV